MPAKVAFDAAGLPSGALLKRLEKEGATPADLHRAAEGGSEYAFLTKAIPGVIDDDGCDSVCGHCRGNLQWLVVLVGR